MSSTGLFAWRPGLGALARHVDSVLGVVVYKTERLRWLPEQAFQSMHEAKYALLSKRGRVGHIELIHLVLLNEDSGNLCLR